MRIHSFGVPCPWGHSSKPLAYVCAAGMDCIRERRVAPGPIGADGFVSTLLSASISGANWLLLHSAAPGRSPPLGPVRLVRLWHPSSELPEFKRLCCTSPKYLFFLKHGTEYIATCCWERNRGSHIDHGNVHWGCCWRTFLSRGSKICHYPCLPCWKGLVL